MIEIRNIICPIDFSEFSRHAVDHAVALAGWYRASITLLHVVPTIPSTTHPPQGGVVEPAPLTAADRDRIAGEIKQFVSSVGDGVRFEIVVREGQPTVEILQHASTMRADLLTMATHGRSGFEALILGSVTEKVLRKAPCPVLTVPPRAPDVEATAPLRFKRILCPVDFCDSSTNALTYALSLAQEADARLTVLHVAEFGLVDSPDMVGSTVDDWPANLAELRRKGEEIAQKRLTDIVPESARSYCTVDTMLVSHGKPYREILRVAGEQQSDLIVVGVHSLGAAELMFLGSTTQQVVRHAACPVLTIRRG